MKTLIDFWYKNCYLLILLSYMLLAKNFNFYLTAAVCSCFVRAVACEVCK